MYIIIFILKAKNIKLFWKQKLVNESVDCTFGIKLAINVNPWEKGKMLKSGFILVLLRCYTFSCIKLRKKKSHLLSECLNKGASYLPVLWSFSQYCEIVSPEQADLACFSPCPLSVWQWHQHMHYMTVQGTGIVVSTCLFVVLSFTVFKSIGQIQFLYCCHIQIGWI